MSRVVDRGSPLFDHPQRPWRVTPGRRRGRSRAPRRQPRWSERYPREPMPRRATKRGDERTALEGDYDVLICGASFAGLSVARELAGLRRAGADHRPLRDRRAPDLGLRGPDRAGSRPWASRTRCARRSTRSSIHTPHTTVDFRLPWTFSTFDYRQLCGLLFDQCDALFETATVTGRATSSASPAGLRRAQREGSDHQSRPIAATVSAPLVVDALGWKRVLGRQRVPAA